MYFFLFVSVGVPKEAEGSYCRSYFASTCVLVGCIPSNLKQAVRFRTCIYQRAGLNRGRAMYYSEGVFAPLQNCTSTHSRSGGLQKFYGKRPHRLLWAGSPAAPRKITIIGTPNCLKYFDIFVVKQNSNYPDRLGLQGKFVENSTKLTCLEITGFRIKYSTVL